MAPDNTDFQINNCFVLQRTIKTSFAGTHFNVRLSFFVVFAMLVQWSALLLREYWVLTLSLRLCGNSLHVLAKYLCICVLGLGLHSEVQTLLCDGGSPSSYKQTFLKRVTEWNCMFFFSLLYLICCNSVLQSHLFFLWIMYATLSVIEFGQHSGFLLGFRERAIFTLAIGIIWRIFPTQTLHIWIEAADFHSSSLMLLIPLFHVSCPVC